MGDVADDEGLYRVVRKDACKVIDDVPRLSSTAFNDKARKPSTDRARLRNSANESQKEPTDGIALLITQEVRAVCIPFPDPTPNGPKEYLVDVWARPENENPAHAQIEGAPEFITDARFKKLKEALVLLAEQHEWVIKPT